MAKLNRRRKWGLVVFLLILAPAGYVGTDGASGSAVMQALATDPMSIFSARSPGERSDALLSQTKNAYAPAEVVTADYRGAVSESGMPSPEASGDFLDVGPGLDTPQEGSAPALPIPAGLYGPPQDGFFVGGFGGGDLGDDPFTGGGGGIGGSGPSITPPAPPASVPEPDTWLMMIGGFLAVGAAMRSRHRRVVIDPDTSIRQAIELAGR